MSYHRSVSFYKFIFDVKTYCVSVKSDRMKILNFQIVIMAKLKKQTIIDIFKEI